MERNHLADRLLTAADAARYLGYSEGTIRNKASRGEIPFVKLGHALRFRLSELNAWIDEQNTAAKKGESADAGAKDRNVVAVPA